MDANTFLIIVGAILLFLLYLVIDLATSNLNVFLDKWAKKTVWIWLPFYALQRLIREVILKSK